MEEAATTASSSRRQQSGSDPFAWTVDGHNSGALTGPLAVEFSHVENLTGAADTVDTFVVAASGHLDGVLDGGAGGFDSLVLDGGVFSSVVYAATGPGSGAIDRDGTVLTYAGLEPITDNSIVADWVFDPTSSLLDGSLAGDDKAILRWVGADFALGPGYMVLESLDGHFESITFRTPSSSISINLGAGNDELTIGTLDPQFRGDLIVLDDIDEDDSDLDESHFDFDTVTFSESINPSGGNINVAAENIVVGSGVVIDTRDRDINSVSVGDSGDIKFKGNTISINSGASLLSSSNPGSVFAGGLIEVAAARAPNVHVFALGLTFSPVLVIEQHANITLTDATIDGGRVVIRADAETKPSWADLPDFADFSGGLIGSLVASAPSILTALPELLTGLASPLVGQVSIHKSFADVTLANSTVKSQTSVDVIASAHADSSFTTIGVNNVIGVPFIFSVGYGETLVSANVDVAGTTSVIAENTINIQSQVNSTSDVTARTMANSLASVDAPDDDVPRGIQVEFTISLAIAVSQEDSHVSLGTASLVHSIHGNVNIEALAGDADNPVMTGASADAQVYNDGVGGVTIALAIDVANVTVDINGTIFAENPPAAPGIHEFNAAAAVGVDNDVIVLTVPEAEKVLRGDELVYRAGDGTPIGGLIDGETYIVADVTDVASDPVAGTVTQWIKLSRTAGIDLDATQVGDVAQHTLTAIELLKFLPTQVGQAANGDLTINPVGDLAGVVNGQKLVYLGPNSPVARNSLSWPTILQASRPCVLVRSSQTIDFVGAFAKGISVLLKANLRRRERLRTNRAR